MEKSALGMAGRDGGKRHGHDVKATGRWQQRDFRSR
jgi:hypothetical protein